MRRESRKLLLDARGSAHSIMDFVEGKSLDDFLKDLVLQAAVERHFMIIGEAFARLRERDPDTFARVPEAARAIAFRNFLVHVYDKVDYARVWQTVHERITPLSLLLDTLIYEALKGPS